MSTSVSPSALLAHLVSQTRSNIDFLVSQNVIKASDAATILSRLESVDTNAINSANGSHNTSLGEELNAGRERDSRSPVGSLVNSLRRTSFLGRDRAETPERASSPPKAVLPLRRVVPPPPSAPSKLPQARALWDYNENGSDPNDLSFHSGDIIDILSDSNPDWWTGRLHGKQGLFPSNYVEKLPSSVSPSPSSAHTSSSPIPVPAPMGPMLGQAPSNGPGPRFPTAPPMSHANSYNSYNSPPPPPHYNAPPAPGWAPVPWNEKQQQMSYAPPPPQQVQPPPPPAPAPQPEKKSKFGGLGQTMANSAAGGVGFGAGAAIGGGIINSIF